MVSPDYFLPVRFLRELLGLATAHPAFFFLCSFGAVVREVSPLAFGFPPLDALGR